MLSAPFRLQLDNDVGDPVIETGEASKKVDGKCAGGPLHVHAELMVAERRLHLDLFNLFQQVAHCQDLILLAAHWPRANASDLCQVSSRRNEKNNRILFFFCVYWIKYCSHFSLFWFHAVFWILLSREVR